MLIIAEKEISKLNNNKVFQWIKSKEMVFKDKDNSKYTFIKYPYSENLDLIYGEYLSYIGIDSNLKYAGIYDKEKDTLFALDYNLRNALGLSWDDRFFKDVSELERELIFKLNRTVDDYVLQNKEEFYEAVKDYEGAFRPENVESDFIFGYKEYKYNAKIYKVLSDDILKYLDNEEYVFDWSFDYIQKNKKYIGETLKDIDVKNEYLSSIIKDKTHPLHKARMIRESLDNSDSVTVHVFINKEGIDFDFKYDKSSLTHSLSSSYISLFNMPAQDRQKYAKLFDYNDDFNYKDIYKIEYRNKPIYIDNNFTKNHELSTEQHSL